MLKTALFSLLALGFGLPAVGIADPSADISRLEQDFNAAYAANDLDKYFGHYTDDALLFPEGPTDVPSYKKEWRELLQSGGAIEAGKISGLRVKLSPRGDSAIASYVLHLTQRGANKKVHTEDWQGSDIGFRTNGVWKITHVHYSAAPKPAKKN